MRKSRFKQVENYIELFRKLCEGVYQELDRKDPGIQKACEYLEMAQQKAIDLGNYIEETECEGHKTVSHLEEFCEVLFQIHEEIQSDRGLSASSAKVRIEHCVNNIEKSAHSDIKIKKVAVFLPYKASMWDSLESVWMKARDDENVDDFVIPIPYFERDAEGGLKEMFYEGNQYPKYVPVTDFQKFDFEGVHPDEIYIHNPYDDANYVTSVHPFFYTENLKKFTDKLIYIPYFVLSEPNLDNEAEMDHIFNFALTPGVVYSDEVILQSENMKKAYVACLVKHFGEDSRDVWENKIKGTGSPKFERLLRAKEEEQDIPEEWKKIIMKPDGTRKKIVFYNTGVVAILNQEQKMIDKIKDVFAVFKENKDDVALLWRPHPLIEATLESMVPEILEQYRQIVKEYKEEGWGIYDDSPDMNRAIIISDAYYGDGSSIVQLYEKLEKPIMIQNPDVLCQ
ncbi:CDP-glycerol glycerophosphotransferase family protein [Pseudobutyrivibrio xylanivorans]|uniref:CDP-Glycerol:Poly(Glycerophosphate) glycerophosphotransferase n=1 Tax=Pseudobutyrivibrio xylanivorans TaxID=185007 RepID=A0A1G5RPJ2_PSEXY|nr:CDP-glycerol glycerophosphotransferase family protein [Pseudobutyrivibrio xylanivorans]SCZ76055.1 CDP-Glycerol:Poly(glycerophosphate) glycerophosphotransferase [Pseudobutyrivibrio xylanivorans]